MKIIPAVDIKGGRCVRLTQGKEDQDSLVVPGVESIDNKFIFAIQYSY